MTCRIAFCNQPATHTVYQEPGDRDSFLPLGGVHNADYCEAHAADVAVAFSAYHLATREQLLDDIVTLTKAGAEAARAV
jgi:hypothetical protein